MRYNSIILNLIDSSKYFFLTDKPKLKEEWLELSSCLAEIKSTQKNLAQAEAYERQLSEAEAAIELGRLETIWKRELETEKTSNKAEKFKAYLMASLLQREDECGEKSDEDVRILAMRHSACKPSGKLLIIILVDFFTFFS